MISFQLWVFLSPWKVPSACSNHVLMTLLICVLIAELRLRRRAISSASPSLSTGADVPFWRWGTIGFAAGPFSKIQRCHSESSGTIRSIARQSQRPPFICLSSSVAVAVSICRLVSFSRTQQASSLKVASQLLALNEAGVLSEQVRCGTPEQDFGIFLIL